MPRPSIDESLAEEIKRIHRETQNETASNFQEALDTVVQLALEQADMEQRSTEGSQGWYPGKYANKVVDKLVGRSSTSISNASSTSTQATGDTPSGVHFSSRSPDETAIFKSQVGQERTITIPEAEVKALGLDAEDILQIYAYELETETTD